MIDPLASRIDAGGEVTPCEIYDLARRPEVRPMLFAAMRAMNREDLIPAEFISEIHQAESQLVYWMMHPNELKDPPDQIELVETIGRQVGGESARFHVFKYLMPESHVAHKDGWLLGFSGPYVNSDGLPYESSTGAFSRCGDKYGEVQSESIVDWYLDMLRKKGLSI